MIQFAVRFPKSIPASKLAQLKKLLPDPGEPIIMDDAEIVTLEEIAMNEQQASHDFDQEGSVPHGVQCQAQ